MTVKDTIKQISGIDDPTKDLNITEEEYDDLIDYYITSVTDWFTYYLNKTYTSLPTGLEEIQVEIVCKMLERDVQRQDTPILDSEDDTSNIRVLSVVNDDIRLRLKPYIKKTRIGLFGIGTKTQYDTLMDIDDDSIDDVE